MSQIIISFIETETTPESFDINAEGAFYGFDKKLNLKYFLVFVLVQKVFVNVILDLEYIILKKKSDILTFFPNVNIKKSVFLILSHFFFTF